MQWLYEKNKLHPHKKFINELNYGEVYKKVLAKICILKNIISQKRVGIYAQNSVEMTIILLALMSLKVEIVCFNARLTPLELEQQLLELEVTTLFTNKPRTIDNSAIEIIQIETLTCENYTVEDMNWAEEIIATPVEADKIAFIMNTSATTGKFKSVPMRWSQWLAHVEASAKTLGVLAEDNWLVVLPIFHVSGLSILLRSMYNGTSIHLLEKFDIDSCVNLIQSGDVNLVSLVPTMWQQLLPKLGDKNHNMQIQLRCILLGGEFIPQNLVEESLKGHWPIYKTYGMTETVSQTTTFNVLEYPDKKYSVGRPLPNVQISIDNADQDGIGEIVIRSPMLMKGYLNQEPLPNYLATGDIGYIDADGYLYLLNRRRDLIISGGENIYPQEIENVVYSYGGIKECAIVPQTSAKWGQVPILFIVAQDIDIDDLKKFLQDKLARYKLPQAIYQKEFLPRNAMGKILRQALMDEVEYEYKN